MFESVSVDVIVVFIIFSFLDFILGEGIRHPTSDRKSTEMLFKTPDDEQTLKFKP